ncbi:MULTISPECIES: nicotinate-nucleotide adenylyltransferase [unclassified Synechocystis]|uniref:nicotinate-nucleotide adenylyltransferase n=1 Tax=unclassified Synechocystis TaxID=2640012 RepID=UPI000413E016|nr:MULTISPECIES: nicotinate-nucleotide adenylyltransferase [unclassified Synechocystis]AIE74310.1 Nicotinate-nucleotide adenylyltransferase [Synechocystis sp. PCC 6714]MCT0254904.1 nicotinate-nucleotide adenylyltransferase [Synechocystis sp. CS-94]
MKIALFGTSADPPTLAHRAILVWLAQHFDQVAVWAADNPFKQGPSPQTGHWASLGDRQAMLKLLVEEIQKDYATVQIWEDLSDRRSLISLRRAQQRWGLDPDYALVVGADLIVQIPQWYAVKELLPAVKLVIFPRPGYSIDPSDLDKLEQLGGRYHLVGQDNDQAITPPISSSIYRQIKDDDLIPDPVQNYIGKRQLYRQ